SSALMAPAKDLLSPWRRTEAEPGRPVARLRGFTGLRGTDVRSVGSKLLTGVITRCHARTWPKTWPQTWPQTWPKTWPDQSLRLWGRLISAQASARTAPLQLEHRVANP